MALLPADDEEVSTETREASPANMLIKIESFSLLSEYGIQKYESREFVAGDYKWRLIIYPDGHETENESDHISVYLSVAGTSSLPMDWEVNAMFSIFLCDQISDNYLCFRGKAQRFHAMKSQWGFSTLISKKILTDPSNGHLVDDNRVVGAEVLVIKSQRVIECVSLQKVKDPYKREWKIPQFSKLEVFGLLRNLLLGIYDDFLGKFRRIKLYPNGNGSEKGQSVSIYLESVDSKSFAPHEKVKADFCMTIKSHFLNSPNHSVNFSQWFSSSQPDWGLLDFIPIADMRDPSKGFVVQDCCCLETKISVQVVALDTPKSEYYVPSSKLKIEEI